MSNTATSRRPPCPQLPLPLPFKVSSLQQDCIDPYVPSFSLTGSSDLVVQPSPRLCRSDLTAPTFRDLFELSLLRILDLAHPEKENPPPRLFPTSERVQDQFFFTCEWNEFGNLETEHARLLYTLTRYPERGLPSVSRPLVEALLYCESVLDGWPRVSGSAKLCAEEVLSDALSQMVFAQRGTRDRKEGFLTAPVEYVTGGGPPYLQVSLWKRALAEITNDLQSGNSSRIEQFLQIHACLKDPIGGLKCCFRRQLDIFTDLLASFRSSLSGGTTAMPPETWKAVAAQLAAESSFLSIPRLLKVVYIHFVGHQMLPYVYVSLDKLPRAEFSIPKRVLEIMREMVEGTPSSGSSMCCVAPITIAYCPSLTRGRKAGKVILDGNNRVAAIALLRFLASLSVGGTNDMMMGSLERYCTYHGFDSKWHVDLRDVISELWGSPEILKYLLEESRSLVAKFRTVVRVPALVVQEPSFHTVWVPKTGTERTALLQPMHQSIYNDRSICLAIPAKQQSHGRPLGFWPLPLK